MPWFHFESPEYEAEVAGPREAESGAASRMPRNEATAALDASSHVFPALSTPEDGERLKRAGDAIIWSDHPEVPGIRVGLAPFEPEVPASTNRSTNYAAFKPGWINRQFSRIEIDSRTWPGFMLRSYEEWRTRRTQPVASLPVESPTSHVGNTVAWGLWW